MKNPIFVALDVNDEKKALELAKQISTYVGGFKLGPRLLLRNGQALVSEISKLGPVFIDNKYLDIPNTMVESVRASFDLGASYVTIHAQAGREALEQLAKLEIELQKIRPFKILAVTVLTSLGEGHLPINWKPKSISDHVMSLVEECVQSGILNFVCAATEVAKIKEKFPKSFVLTPGIRLPEDSANDQARVLTPQKALALGSSALVVGRPIVEAKDPVAAAKKFAQAVTQ